MYMTNEDWKYKIINASPTRLVIVTYEIILYRIDEAEEALKERDLVRFRERLTNAREFVTEMLASLDTRSEISGSMAELYLFVNKLIIKSYFSEDAKYMLNASKIIKSLMTALSKEVDDSMPSGKPVISDNYVRPTNAFDR